MVKRFKKCIYFLLILVLILNYNVITASAQTTKNPTNNSTIENRNTTQEMLSLEEYKARFGHKSLKQVEKTSDKFRLSQVKTKTKTIITSINKINAGTVTIKYQSYMESGRPKFALDTVYLSVPPSRVGIWLLVDSDVSYNSDHIGVTYTYSSTVGGLTDYASVSFVPES